MESLASSSYAKMNCAAATRNRRFTRKQLHFCSPPKLNSFGQRKQQPFLLHLISKAWAGRCFWLRWAILLWDVLNQKNIRDTSFRCWAFKRYLLPICIFPNLFKDSSLNKFSSRFWAAWSFATFHISGRIRKSTAGMCPRSLPVLTRYWMGWRDRPRVASTTLTSTPVLGRV